MKKGSPVLTLLALTGALCLSGCSIYNLVPSSSGGLSLPESSTVADISGKTLESIAISGLGTTYTEGAALSLKNLVVTATFTDGYASPVEGYTSDPAAGSILTTETKSITITYTHNGVSKSLATAITVFPKGSGHELMFRVNEILATQYCDSLFIKYGDFECLVDGGSAADEETVSTSLSAYCTDHVLDLYIGTHAHEDHMGVFGTSGSYTSNSKLDNVFRKGGITQIAFLVDCGSARSSVQFFRNYLNVIKPYMIDDLGATYIPVHSFFNKDAGYEDFCGLPSIGITGEADQYGECCYLTQEITSDIALTFLNTDCYLTPGDQDSSDQNTTSVACYLKFFDHIYVFSGDGTGEVQDGIMANYSKDGSCSLWDSSNDVYLKANHHGSDTASSNSQSWIDWVGPDHVFVSAAITQSNMTSAGVNSVQHPNPNAIKRFEKATYDIHWNGVNGSFDYLTSSDGTLTSFEGSAKKIPYYDSGAKVTGEEKTSFPMSKWCRSSSYSSCARATETGKDAARGSPLGSFLNWGYDYGRISAEAAEVASSNGELYDELSHSFD